MGQNPDEVSNLIFNSKIQFVDSVYLMCTTMTTVGYGDNSGSTIKERFFLSIIMFFGLAMFTIISNQVMSQRKQEKVEDLVRDSNINIVNYLYDLS